MARSYRQPSQTRTRREASYDVHTRRSRQERSERAGLSDTSSLPVMRWIFMLFVGLSILAATRVLWLQLVDGQRLRQESEQQIVHSSSIFARRGTIYDRNGNVLATSVECRDIYANPRLINDASSVADILVEVLGLEKEDLMKKLTKDTTFVYILQQADIEQAQEIKTRLREKKLDGIYSLPNMKRVYPYGTTAAQILGFVGRDGKGLSGIELQYNDILTGSDGSKKVEVGRSGVPIAGGNSEIVEAQHGTSLILTIDIDLQQACEQIITEGVETYHSKSGSIMVTNPKNGEIYAACSTPLPDFSNLEDASALNLKLVSSSYEPGSIFKVLTTSIGFDAGLFTPDTTFDVPAMVKVGDQQVKDDDNRTSAMSMTVREMMRRSSNTGMVILQQKALGAKLFAERVADFGLGTRTGIDFPGEEQGLVTPYEKYDGGTAGSMSFGQAVAIPMIQMVRAYGAVANDGKATTPHFLMTKGEEEVTYPEGPQIISSEAAHMTVDVMRTIMQEGTGKNGNVAGYDLAGKTGTGEQASESGGYRQAYFVASLCGFINSSNPDALVYVGLNGLPHLASQSSAHLFKDVVLQTVRIMGIAPSQG